MVSARVWAREGLVNVGLASMNVSDVGCCMAMVIFPVSLLLGDGGLAICWLLFRVELMLGFGGDCLVVELLLVTSGSTGLFDFWLGLLMAVGQFFRLLD
jgi:hypothetical protein